MSSTIVLVVAAAVTVWSAVGLVAALFLGRLISSSGYDEVELAPDETWLDDQPADVLADAALRGRFNKTLIDNNIEDF